MQRIKRINQGLRWNYVFSLQGIGVICEYEFLSFWRTKAKLLNDLLWLPILYPLLFVAGIASFVPKSPTLFGTESYLSFVCPGLIGLRVFGQFSNVIYRLTIDKRYGLQGLKIGSGVGVLGYVLGHFALPSLVIAWQTLITLVVFILFSIPIPTIQQLFLTFCIAIISAWFWGALAMLVSFSFKRYYKRDLFIGTVSLPLTLSCPVFFPLEHAPT